MIEELKNNTPKEKANIKSIEIAKLKIAKFKKGDLIIEIIGDIVAIDGGIQLFAKSWKSGKQLGFGKDGLVEIERFRFYNPPILVDDPNGNIIRKWEEKNLNTKKTETKQRILKYSPEEAIKEFLSHTISLVGKENANIVKDKVGNTTSTFYPAAGANSPVDGHIRSTDQTPWSSWTILRAATGMDMLSDDTGAFVIFSRMATGQTENTYADVGRGIFLFDTSSIGTDVVDSATLSLYGTGKWDDNSYIPVTEIVSCNPASNATIAANLRKTTPDIPISD